MKKAVVLVSGGIDSAVALDWAQQRYRPLAVSFQVAGRPRGEVRACAGIVRRAGVEHVAVAVPFLKPRASGYAPARNLVFHSIALAIAEDRGAAVVVAGHNASDAAFFADARPAYFRKLERLGKGIRIVLPFARMTDAQVIARGLERGLPLERTWSCYRDGARPCRRCSACRGRIESWKLLKHLRMEDPS